MHGSWAQRASVGVVRGNNRPVKNQESVHAPCRKKAGAKAGALPPGPSLGRSMYGDLENKNPVEMALKWLWNKKEVSFMLSGMSSIEQVKQNISYASNSKIGCLTSSESNLIKKVQIELSKTISIPCTKCNYCTPCPSKINIPYIFSLYNEAMKYANSEITNLQLNKALYNNLPKEVNASACVKCKKCEPKCPQTINITDLLEKAHNKLYDPKL